MSREKKTLQAKELFEQHQAEIATAQREVNRLQAAIQQALQKSQKEKAYSDTSAAYTEAQEAWQAKAIDLVTTLQRQGEELYRLEARVQQAHRDLSAAGNAMNIAAPNIPRFPLYPVLLEQGLRAHHSGGGAVALQLVPNKRYYNVKLEPELQDVSPRG